MKTLMKLVRQEIAEDDLENSHAQKRENLMLKAIQKRLPKVLSQDLNPTFLKKMAEKG